MAGQTSYQKFIRKLLGSRIFLLAISLILVGLAVSVGQESYRKYQLTREIGQLKLEIERLEGRNRQLSDLMNYFQEESYLEKEARLKLNLKKPGEKVVILSQDNLGRSNDKSQAVENPPISQESQSRQEKANFWQWWEYFFARD